MDNKQQKQPDNDSTSSSNKNEATTEATIEATTEATTDDQKTSTATTDDRKTSPLLKQKLHPDPCSICMENVCLLDIQTYQIGMCCGKVIHKKCMQDLKESELNNTTKNSCPMCRSMNQKPGSKEEIKRLRKWVKRGRAFAQAMLGGRYMRGVGVKQDSKRAVILYRLAAAQGHCQSQYNLGCYYRQLNGFAANEKQSISNGGVDHDFLAVEFFSLAAEQGHAEAQFNLGNLYGKGVGVEKSLSKAHEWLVKAAARGQQNAIVLLQKINKINRQFADDEQRQKLMLSIKNKNKGDNNK